MTQTGTDSLLLPQLCPGSGILWLLSLWGSLSPSFQGLYLGQLLLGALPAGLGLDVLLGVWFFVGLWGLWQGKLLDDLQGRKK